MAALHETITAVVAGRGADVGRGLIITGDIGHLKVWPLPNVWLGVSAEDQTRADERIPHLLATPAAVRFLSYEPALGPVDPVHAMIRWAAKTPIDPPPLDPPGSLDWIIAGGESGPGARPAHPDWFRSLRDQCAAAGVPFFFKQWGEWQPVVPIYGTCADVHDVAERFWASVESRCEIVAPNGSRWGNERAQPPLGSWMMERVGKKAAGRLLDGVEHNGMPGDA